MSVFCLWTDRIHYVASSFEMMLKEVKIYQTDPRVWWFKIDEAYIEEWTIDGPQCTIWRFDNDEWRKQ